MRSSPRLLAAVLASVSVAALGCTPGVSEQGKKLCAQATAAFDKGDYAATIRHMDAFLKDNAATAVAGRAFYLRGQAKYRLGRRQEAKADFEQALSKTRDALARANASVALGDIAWEANDMREAERMYRQALAYCERDVPPADQAYYRLGCVLQRLGRWADADLPLNRVVHAFADSEFARRAARRTHARRWTVQAGAFRHRRPAELDAEKLRRKNLPAASRSAPQSETPLFVVEVGRYRTYEQAVAALVDVQQHRRDAFVTVTR